MNNKIMIHYGELYTKGKNRSKFIATLSTNIKRKVKNYKGKVRISHDHIYITDYLEDKTNEIIEILQTISGIHAISLISLIDRDIQSLLDASLKLVNESAGKSFKVITKRVDKFYPMLSDNINRTIGGHIIRNSTWKVDVHNPDLKIVIQIHPEGAYFITKTVKGLGGYPLGSLGKTLLMISGGIDSPVAAYHLIRRGIRVECIHFASPPYTSENVITKIKKTLQKLNVYQDNFILYVIPFTKIQEEIYKNVPSSYAITIMRRMMYRLATGMARYKKVNIIATGESLGQVASQTSESLKVINDVTNMPFIRPLATMDKLEIMETARKLDTYDISIQPYEDCCTIFPNKNPITKPKNDTAKMYEETFDFQPLIKEALHNFTKYEINSNQTEEEEELL